ncbi:MAG: ABC transporter ATP-binding protein [Anaerovibrio sp.]|uniref:ABC transporter ATP-binding protein n=1 Tax=Anaerovibrio sp. TaxID=1872532 RepID=UPI0025ECC033|nr:ABC transporter ATP-binding protein [Anaerovibrio sp.]MCR5176662.1 ABC transporter ATP-binding protein [Anaerovibrio sp.]
MDQEKINAIDIINVHCQAKGKEILHGISFSVKMGEVMGLLGPNGAGKTSLIKLICGLGPCSHGEINLMGMPAGMDRDVTVKALVGLVPQVNNIEPELTVRESMICYAELYGVPQAKQRVAEMLDRFDMLSWADKRPEQISGGMHRRAMIARAALPDPEILILDEPSVGLDPELRQGIWQQIENLKKMGKTILITTHYMEEADHLCDRIAMIKEGKLILVDTAQGIKDYAAGRHTLGLTLEEAYLELVTQKGAEADGLGSCL